MSYQRRILHGKIDILRAELVARLQKTEGRSVLDQVDVESLTEILAGKAAPPSRMSHVYCPECGFQNPEAANYCAKCGALLHRPRERARRRRRSRAEEARGAARARSSDLGVNGPALVVRSGGGRAGETFAAEDERHDDRPLARLRDLPRRRHRLPQARRARPARRPLADRGPGQPQRHVRQPRAGRVGRRSRTATRSRSASTG